MPRPTDNDWSLKITLYVCMFIGAMIMAIVAGILISSELYPLLTNAAEINEQLSLLICLGVAFCGGELAAMGLGGVMGACYFAVFFVAVYLPIQYLNRSFEATQEVTETAREGSYALMRRIFGLEPADNNQQPGTDNQPDEENPPRHLPAPAQVDSSDEVDDQPDEPGSAGPKPNS